MGWHKLLRNSEGRNQSFKGSIPCSSVGMCPGVILGWENQGWVRFYISLVSLGNHCCVDGDGGKNWKFIDRALWGIHTCLCSYQYPLKFIRDL